MKTSTAFDVVGGVLAATAVVLLFVEGREPEKEKQTVHLVPVLGQQNGLMLRGRF